MVADGCVAIPTCLDGQFSDQGSHHVVADEEATHVAGLCVGP
jgi:hypothetical protein